MNTLAWSGEQPHPQRPGSSWGLGALLKGTLVTYCRLRGSNLQLFPNLQPMTAPKRSRRHRQVGLEPPIFRLTAERANRLRHRDNHYHSSSERVSVGDRTKLQKLRYTNWRPLNENFLDRWRGTFTAVLWVGCGVATVTSSELKRQWPHFMSITSI